MSWLVIHASATAVAMKAAENDYPRPAHHRAPRGRRGRNGPAVSGRLPGTTGATDAHMVLPPKAEFGRGQLDRIPIAGGYPDSI